jgi:hypothetical protein
MNDDLKLTDDQLRLATSRSLPPDAALDAQTAAARDSFIALGASLESAAGQLDEAALVAQLTTSSLASQGTEVAVVSRKPAQRDWWAILLSSALAAAALVAMARIASESRQRDQLIAGASVADETLPAQNDVPIIALTAGWTDPLDDEIALAAATIDQLVSRRADFDGSLREMNQQLEALSHELLGESL